MNGKAANCNESLPLPGDTKDSNVVGVPFRRQNLLLLRAKCNTKQLYRSLFSRFYCDIEFFCEQFVKKWEPFPTQSRVYRQATSRSHADHAHLEAFNDRLTQGTH